ncbi:feruloyl esterase-like protein [Amylocystis lapponica]|nr:feruloyl esterase-like protein [Amylocystis lapponica]
MPNFSFARLSRWLVPLCLLISRALAWGQACSSFAPQGIVDVALLNTSYFPAHALVNFTNLYQSIDTDTLPAFCVVRVQITTNATTGSSCETEIWLPDDWNGRFLTIGNGGYAGGIPYQDAGFIGMTQGFATVSTNTGHYSGSSDGSFAGPGNNNTINDWGWRSIRLSVVYGKEIVQQYYGRGFERSYYLGCSEGDKVQEYPDDFDGVIVGSPANWQTHLEDWGIRTNLNVYPYDGPSFINESLWVNLIHQEVLRQCDALDGLADGVVSVPERCNFRPETLACRPGQNASTCMNELQIEALYHIYSPYVETNQTWMFGAYYPGGEVSFPQGLVGGDPALMDMARGWFQWFVLNDTTWDIDQYNYSLALLADEINPGSSNAINPNITAFAGPDHNGKLLHWVGWADQLISPGNSIHYYESVNLFTKTQTSLNTEDFYRFFTVPGMYHWYVTKRTDRTQGGYGANAFGQSQQPSGFMPPLQYDAQHNILAAMVRWVEEGIAPETLTAVYWNNNNDTEGVGFTRPLCQYPQYPQYRGGDSNLAESFECVF